MEKGSLEGIESLQRQQPFEVGLEWIESGKKDQQLNPFI